MRGEMVVVKDFRGRALIRRVWDADAGAVYITDDQQFERLLAGQEGLLPVGFPREDVFEYRPDIVGSIATGSVEWNKLKLWKGKETGRQT